MAEPWDRDVLRPPTSVRLLCEVACELGIDPEACLANTGLSVDDLGEPGPVLTLGQEIQAIKNFVEAAPRRPGLGVEVGRRFHVNAFGIWGFAIMTSPTVRAAIEVAVEYASLSFVIADMRLEDAGDCARLVFDLSRLPSSIRRFVLERHCQVALMFFRDFLQDAENAGLRIEILENDADYAAAFCDVMGMQVAPSARHDAVVIPQHLMDGRLPKFDPATLKFCLDQCSDLVGEIAGSAPWTGKVRDLALENLSSDLKIDDVATALNVTARTLRRRLADEGATFRDVYAEARLTIARQLLSTAGLTVEATSWRVGYAEPASFVRAFSRRFGVTPGSVRAGRRSPAPA